MMVHGCILTVPTCHHDLRAQIPPHWGKPAGLYRNDRPPPPSAASGTGTAADTLLVVMEAVLLLLLLLLEEVYIAIM